MKKLFLLAMLAVFQLPALMAQSPVFIGTKPSDDGIKRELYRVGTETRIKCIFENGDFFWQLTSPHVESGGDLDRTLPFKVTFNDAVAVHNEDGYFVCYLSGDSCQLKESRVIVSLTEELVENFNKEGMIIYNNGKRVSEPDFRIREDHVIGFVKKVGYDKYEKYVAGEAGLCRLNDSHRFFFTFDSKIVDVYTHYQYVGKSRKKEYFDSQYRDKSCSERLEKYNIDLFKEITSYNENIVPNNLQKEYIIGMVEKGKGGAVGLEGMTYKDLKKKVKKGEIDLDAVVKRYEYMLDSIMKSWIVVEEEEYGYIYPVDRNDTIVSFSVEKGQDDERGIDRYYHTLHYKNGDSIVFNTSVTIVNEKIRPKEILTGVLTKDNGKLIINSQEDIVLELNNGDKFFANNLVNGIRGSLFNHKVTPWNGTLSKADGTAEEMEKGYTESQRIAMQKAEEERKTKMAAEARAELCAKFGEKYVKAYEEGEFVKGMPDVLVNEVCKKGGMVLKSPKRWSDGTTRYEVHFPFNTILGQGTWIGYVYMDNGRLSWWRIDL